MDNEKPAYRSFTRIARSNDDSPAQAEYFLWATCLKHILGNISQSSIPTLYWDSYHRWSRSMKALLKRAGLISYVLSPHQPRDARKSILALALMRPTISRGVACLLPRMSLTDPRKLWVALEDELVPKGVSTYLLCSISLREGRKARESVSAWEFRSLKLREEIRYCGVEGSPDLEYVVQLMMELGDEFEGLKSIWLGMGVDDLRRDAVDIMVEGWIVGLCAEEGGGDM